MLNLPEPDDSLLPQSPLELVVTQIRFEPQEQIAEARLGFAFRDALNAAGAELERTEPMQGQAINIGVGIDGSAQVAQGPGPRGWRFSSADGVRSVALLQDSLGIEVRRYDGWADFHQHVERALGVLVEHVAPEVELRLGLRYIDRITEVGAEAPSAWAGYLAEPLRGFLAHPTVAESVKAQQHQVVFDLGHGECRMIHGTLPAEGGKVDYVLDYDLYREDPQPFSVDAVLDGLERFHTDALKLFQASTEPTLKALFA